MWAEPARLSFTSMRDTARAINSSQFCSFRAGCEISNGTFFLCFCFLVIGSPKHEAILVSGPGGPVIVVSKAVGIISSARHIRTSSIKEGGWDRLKNSELLLPLQMPLKRLVKDLLRIPLQHISMTRDEGVKVPAVDELDAVVEAGAVLGDHIPVEALHPLVLAAVGVVQALKRPPREVGRGALGLGHAAVLLPGGQVEHQVRLDEGAVRPVEEDELAVAVPIDILVVEVGVKVLPDANIALAGLGEDDGKLFIADLGVVALGVLLGALLGETLWADELGRGEGLGPLADEDVVLNVKGDDVGHVAAHLVNLGPCIICEGYRGEDGEVAGAELDYIPTSVRT